MKRILSANLIFCTLLLAACAPAASPPVAATATATPKPTPTPLMTATATLEQNATEEPDLYRTSALSDFQTDQFFSALNSDECILPCYLGITPGLTTLEDAFSSLGALGLDNNWVWDFIDGDKSMHLYLFNSRIEDSIHRVYLGVIDHQVEYIRVDIHIGVFRFEPSKTFHWKRFDVAHLIEELGEPDEIGVPLYDSRQAVYLLFKGKGILFEANGGPQTNGEICFDPNTLHVRSLYLFNPEADSTLSSFNMHIRPADSFWVQIDYSLNIDNNEFINQIVSNPDRCYAFSAE